MTYKYLENEHNLPIPRLQARLRKEDNQVIIEYSLITKNIEGDFEYLHHESKYVSKNIENTPLFQLRPHNTMAIIFADMWSLKLPTFIVSKEGFNEITFENSIAKIPNGVLNLMQKDKKREEEFNIIINKLIDLKNKKDIISQ